MTACSPKLYLTACGPLAYKTGTKKHMKSNQGSFRKWKQIGLRLRNHAKRMYKTSCFLWWS